MVNVQPEKNISQDINESARTALKVLLDDAEAREYNPPIPGEALAAIEWIIDKTSKSEIGKL